MKTTKKVLSVFLAVLMIMSSMSVCFGTISFAATDTSAIENFVSAVQCDAMKTFSDHITTGHTSNTTDSDNKVYNNKWIYTAPNYEYYLQMKNVVLKLHGAITGLDEYISKYQTHYNSAKCSRNSRTCCDTSTLLTALKSAIGDSYTTLKATYNIENLLSYVLSTNNAYLFSKTGSVTKSSVPSRVYNILVLKTNLVSYLKYFSKASDIDADTVDLTYTYTFVMTRESHGGATGYGTYYHNAVSPSELTKVPVSGDTTDTNRNVLVAMEKVLNDNKDYLNKTTVAGVHSVSTNPETLNAAATAIETAYSELKTTFGTDDAETLFNHFFSGDIAYSAVPTLVELIKKSAVIAGYKSPCETIAKDYAIYVNETYKTYSSTEVNALYNELKTAYEGYTAADDSLEAEIAAYYGIDGYIANIPDALDALLAYYYQIFLGSIKERAFGTDDKAGYVATWKEWTVEDIDNDVITSADILTALSEVNLDIDTLNTDASEDDVQGYFGKSKDELIGILTTVKTHLENLGYYAGLNDELYAQYATFTNNIANVINADSSKLYSVLSGYEAWHQNLQNFFTTWETEVGEYKDLLEDDLKKTMNDYMKAAYTALKTRVVTQIANAYSLYEVYYQLYENDVTMASLTYFNTLKKAIDAIEHNAYSWMLVDHETYGTAIDTTSIDKYDALQVIYNNYGTFVANRGFDHYTQTVVDTVREDTEKDIARENADTDDDGIGEYEVADEDIEAIIDLLEAALKDEKIKALLGNLINKDEDGNPTGEDFDLANLINGLLEDNLYSDNLVNTIIQFLYPIVAKAFLDVWEGIDPFIETTVNISDSMSLDVKASLELYDVDTAIEAAGIALAPVNLANKLSSNTEYATKYAEIINILKSVDTKTSYDVEKNYIDPWKDTKLYKDVLDESTGETKQVMVLDWGIDEAENKRAAFIDAACAALSGLEPLLYALLLNQEFVSPNIADADGGVRGGKIGVNGAGTKAYIGSTGVSLTLDPITLMLDVSANDGWDNVLAPLFELLGLEKIPHSEDMKTTKDLLTNLFAMIDQLIAKVAANPIKTILDIVPNLVYALEADLLAPVLDLLAIEIYYEADVHYSALPIPLILPNGINGDIKAVLKAENPEYINVGQMVDLESMGVNLSGGLAGILEMLGLNIPMPDVSVLATAGELTWVDTNRSAWTYSYQPANVSGKAAHIVANRADVLEYLVKWALGNLPELLAAFGVDTSAMSEAIVAILNNLSANADDSTAAIVELLNQKVYNTLETYEWYEGGFTASATADIDFTPADEIYLSYDNDWTEDKAQYIYDNLDAIVAAVLTMAKVDLDKETEEIETLEEFVGGMLDGLLSDKTLTSLAALLAKLDLNALLAGEDGEEAAIDANALVNDLLGIDLASVAAKYAGIAAAKEADENYVYDFGVDAGTTTFSAALTEMLAPLDSVLGFILTGDNINITFAKGTDDAKSATLIGYDGYNNAIIPLLEALGCTVAAQGDMTGTQALKATLDALLAKIDALTTNTEDDEKDGLIYGVIDMLPGILYFLSSNGLATTVRNLLQPVYVILDTIRPIYDLDINAIVENIEIGEEGNKKPLGLDLDNLHTAALLDLVANLVGLDLSELQVLIYDVCKVIGVDYSETAKSTLQTTWKKGAYSETFTQADMITVVLSFLLEWVTVEENAEALDNMLGTDGIVAALSTVFADVSDEIVYSTPNWMYWFETQEEFEAYIATGAGLPNTLLALEYPNDWDEYTAAYIANNLPAIVDEVVALIEINGVKHDSVSALLNSLISDYISADTINDILDMLKGVLANIDDALLDCGYLLDVDLVGLKNYTCTKEITTISEFAAELAYILDTYAPTIVNLLFFGDDIRLAKKSDSTDTIVINGGLGYEKGLALILEVLGCDVPVENEETDEKEVTTATVLDALAKRIEYILSEGNTVNAVIDLLPNLIYFLNANGLSVAVNNLLQPVYAIVDKVNALGILEEPISIADLIKFKTTDEDGNEKEVKLNLDTLTLDYIVDLVETLTGLDLTVVDEMLVDFCLGKIEKGAYTYKMTAAREDVITLVLTVALLVVETEGNAEVIDELIGKDIIAGIKEIISGANIEYTAPEWDYALAADNALIDYAITYPNNWTDVTATYVAENLDEIVDAVISLIEINGVKHESVSALIDSMVNIYTKENLEAIQKLLADLIGGLDEDLKDLVNIALGAADALLGADVKGLIEYDVSNVNDKESFINALTGMLMEVEGLVNWLLLGEDYEFFVDDDDDMVYEDGEAIITITGANGYAEGLALLLEALGCENLPTVYDKETIDTEATVKAVLTSLANRIDEVLANPVEEVVELLPNIFYFLNTNGVAAVIDNTIAAVMALVEKLDVFGVELDINELVNLKKILKIEDTDAKISLDNLAMSDILEAVSLMTGLDITMIEDVLVGFALGQIAEYDSVSAQVGTAKKMSYKDDFDKADLLTVVATLALLTLTDDENAEVVTNLLGEGVYNTIINVINMEQFVPEMKTMNWILTEYADTNTAVSGIATSELYKDWGYGTLYTEEMAQYIADNFGKFVDNILFLLGIEINGVSVESLKEIFDELLGGTLYTTDTLNTVLNLLRKIPSFITDFAGADLTKHVNEILKTSIGVDLTYWDAYEVAEVTDREGFVAELCRMLEPFYPVLKWLLADEDFAFFVDGANEGDDMIVLYGAEGYTYGIAPILEALQCEGVLSGEAYLAAVEADDSAILSSILTPLLDKVDTILYAEENGSTIADEILALLPSVIYFINSNGLDTSVKNLLNAVYTVLNAIEPITGEINLYDLIGLDLENLTFEEIFDLLLEMIGGAAGYDLSSFSADYVAELTTGYVVSYTSANGETAYTMVYAEGESGTASDMVTIIIRLALTFLALEENQAKVLAILAEQFNMDADAQKYLAGVFEAIAECEIGTQIGMDKACAVVYYLFYGADIGVDFAATGIKDLNAEWQKVLEELGKTPLGTEPTFGNLISRFLDVTMKDILDDVLNSDGVAPNGFIKFFQKIIDWFKSLMAWFQSIFS